MNQTNEYSHCIHCKEDKLIKDFRKGSKRTCRKCHYAIQKSNFHRHPCRTKKRKRQYVLDEKINRREQCIMRMLKRRAKVKLINFNLEISDIRIPKVCPVLGIELSFTNNHHNDSSPSVDRLIPALGYVKGNIQIISNRANRLKNNGTIEEHKKLIEYMEKFTPKIN